MNMFAFFLTLCVLAANFCSSMSHPEKQRELLKCDVLEVLDDIYNTINDKESVHAFMKAGINSISPKMRRKAKELVRKYRL